MSSIWALKMSMSLRSVSSRPRPTYWRPAIEVSRPFDVQCRRAPRPTASSFTVPEIEHQPHARPTRRCARPAETPRTRGYSSRVRSTPGGAERRHHRAPARARSRARGRVQRDALFRCTTPPAVSACRVRYSAVSQLLAAAGDPDQRVDVLRPELERLVGPGPRHQVLPGQRHRVLRIEAAAEAERPRARRPAAAGCRTPTRSRAGTPAPRPRPRTPRCRPGPTDSGPAW